jgi:hypothetical protein
MEKEKTYKYECKQCDFRCNPPSVWQKHIETEKHKTGKKKKRSDYIEPYKCEKCDYKTKNKINFNQHNLNFHATKEEREEGFKYYCKICDFGTFSKDFFENHCNNKKHTKRVENYK